MMHPSATSDTSTSLANIANKESLSEEQFLSMIDCVQPSIQSFVGASETAREAEARIHWSTSTNATYADMLVVVPLV